MNQYLVSVQHSGLWYTDAYWGGKWRISKSRFPVRNPATGEVLAEVSDCDKEETNSAIEAAALAFSFWRRITAKERSLILRRWYDLIKRHEETLAQLITLECGKPFAEARAEVSYAASFVEWFSEEAKRIYGDVIPSPAADRRLLAWKEPVGVVAAITPWNFPAAMVTRKVAAAVAAGCTVVVKPAEQTPLTALALVALAEQAGFPEGVINIIPTSQPKTIGMVLTSNPTVRKISFTGSTEVGRWLAAASAPTLKRLSLELGGNAPFIVFADADLEAAVAGALAAKYRNGGQTCICANRLLVDEKIYDIFVTQYAAAVARLTVGPGWHSDIAIGPLIEEAAIKKVEELVTEAVKEGARVVVGGCRLPEIGPLFYAPTVLADVTPSMKVAEVEIFGPVAPVFRFKNEEEAVALANQSQYGLAAYVYTKDIGRLWRISEALEVGMIGVNTGLISSEVFPFGGVKQSGYGREGSKYGIEEYLQIKAVTIAGI